MTTHLRYEKGLECVSVNAYERDTLNIKKMKR